MNATLNNPVIPNALSPGDTIGIAAPAGPFDREKFLEGINVIKSMGFRVLIPDGLYEKNDYLAGSDTHRADIVNRFFKDTAVKAVMCARGGFGSIRILPLLDVEAIKENPKIFMGFSDITAILSFLYLKCNLVSFHGPVVTSLADSDTATRESLIKALTAGKKLNIKPANGRVLKRGMAKGPVYGGNLATLCHFTGTEFEPDLTGHILFLEDTDEPHYKIDRMLTQMKLAGVLDGMAGLALGSFKNCGTTTEGVYNIVERIFRDFDIPVLAGFDIGHENSNMTVPVGIKATLDTDSHMFLFHEPSTMAEP